MGVCGSLHLKIPFWMSEHLYVFIKSCKKRNVWFFSSGLRLCLCKYLMLFAIPVWTHFHHPVVLVPENKYLCCLYSEANTVFLVLLCVVGRDCVYTSDWDSGSLEHTGTHRGNHEKSRLLKALYLGSWSDSLLSARVCVCMTVQFCLGVGAQQISCEHLGLLSSSDVILSDFLFSPFFPHLSLSLSLSGESPLVRSLRKKFFLIFVWERPHCMCVSFKYE